MVETTNTTRKQHKSLKHLVLTEVLLCFFRWNQEIRKISEVLAEATLPMGGPAAGFGANSKKHFTTSSAAARGLWSRLDTLMATCSKGYCGYNKNEPSIWEWLIQTIYRDFGDGLSLLYPNYHYSDPPALSSLSPSIWADQES